MRLRYGSSILEFHPIRRGRREKHLRFCGILITALPHLLQCKDLGEGVERECAVIGVVRVVIAVVTGVCEYCTIFLEDLLWGSYTVLMPVPDRGSSP